MKCERSVENENFTSNKALFKDFDYLRSQMKNIKIKREWREKNRIGKIDRLDNLSLKFH